MAVQTIGVTSSTGTKNWVQLASTTANNTASTVTFSSVPAYPSYKLVLANINTTTSSTIGIRVNNDALGRYGYTHFSGNSQLAVPNDTYFLFGSQTGNSVYSGFMFIESAASYPTASWTAAGTAGTNSSTNATGVYYGTVSQINRFDIISVGALNFVTGTFILFGSN